MLDTPKLGGVEITLPRREKKTSLGYKGFEFEFSPEIPIEEDLRRRDFTINAMAIDCHGNLIDPFNGQEDLKNKIIRYVSSFSFTEDPLRVIRACRFSSKGFSIHPETLNLMNQISTEEFKALPIERFTGELLKSLNEKYTENFFLYLSQVPKACQIFFPELLSMKIIPAGPEPHHPAGESVLDHTLKILSQCNSPASKFAAFLHDIGKIATPPELLPRHHEHEKRSVELIQNLKLRWKGIPNNFWKTALTIAELHMIPKNNIRLSTAIKVAEKIRHCFNDFIAVCTADGSREETISLLKKAHEIIQIPPRKLIPIEKLRTAGKNASALILQARIELLKKEFNGNK